MATTGSGGFQPAASHLICSPMKSAPPPPMLTVGFKPSSSRFSCTPFQHAVALKADTAAAMQAAAMQTAAVAHPPSASLPRSRPSPRRLTRLVNSARPAQAGSPRRLTALPAEAMILASTLGLSTDEAQATEIACTQKIYSQLHDRDSMKRSIDVFHSFDTSKDGAITSSEFRAALHAMSLGLTEVECQYLIFRLDRNNDGWIAFSEFDNFVTESLGAYHEEIERLASGAEEGQKAARLQREREVRVLRDQRVALFHDWRRCCPTGTSLSTANAASRTAAPPCGARRPGSSRVRCAGV